MKGQILKVFFLTLNAWFVGSSCFAQQYIPMLDETNEWRVVSCFDGCVTDAYFTAGDTLLDGMVYRVLDGYHYINGNMLIREDIEERKVYLKQTFGHSILPEFTLYDFSLDVGDTIDVYNPLSPLPEYGGKFVLDSVITKTLETADHRHFYLHAVDPSVSNSSNTVWVEGIGALSLINSPGAMPTEAEHMVCAFQNGELLYSDLDSVYSCGPLASENVVDHPSSGLVIYPNPANEKLHLTVSGLKAPVYLELFDAKGQKVLSGNWTEQVQVQNIENGLYLLIAVLEDGAHVTKLVLIAH